MFFSYCKRPLFKKYQNVYNAECPVCKEGKSSGRSRRLFYFPLKGYYYCHNCSKSWKPFEWIKEVTSLSVPEIIKKNNDKIQTNSSSLSVQNVVVKENPQLPILIEELPDDSIDLTNLTQLSYYQENKYVKLALESCKNRRLFTAINSCHKFYISLNDKVHKNRLVIPFFVDQKVACYQTRSLTKEQFPRYLTKFGEKEVFGVDNIKAEIPYIFIFEGPIDSMFVQNGVAIASLAATETQTKRLDSFIGYEKIYVFDNDKNNAQTYSKIENHIKQGKTVFIWPKEFDKFKDFNEICCNLNIDEIPWKFVVNNSEQSSSALIKFKLKLGSRNTKH